MRARLLPVLAALCLALPAGATGRTGVIVVRHPIDAASVGTTPQNLQTSSQLIESELLVRNSPTTLLPASACVTADISNNRFSSEGVTTQAAITIHENWSLVASQNLYPSTFQPWTFLSGATWPAGPQIWFIAPVSGCGVNDPTPTDSMGVSDCYGGATPRGTIYDTSNPGLRWKNLYASPKAAVRCNASNPRCGTPVGGILRCVLGFKVSAGSNTAVAKDVDSLLSLKTGSTEDSMLVWTWERYPGDPARQIFCQAAVGGILDQGAILMAFALGESTCVKNGDTMFPDRAAMTQEYGLGLMRANGYGKPKDSNLFYNGVYCPPGDSCDIPNVTAGLDTLKKLGINATAFVDPESLSTSRGATLMALLLKYPNISFALQPVSGTYVDGGAGASTTRAGGAGRCIDPIGILRRRTIFPYPLAVGARYDTLTCVADSGSVACNLINGYKALAAYVGPDRVDWTLAPGAWDWTPQEWTVRAAGAVQAPIDNVINGNHLATSGGVWGGQDSLVAAFRAARIRSVLFCPTAPGANVGVSWSAESGTLTGGTAPAGWAPNESQLRFNWGGITYDGVALLGTRWEPDAPMWTWQQATHGGLGNEWNAGATTGKFYLFDAGVYYKHSFYTSTKVFAVQFASLGGPWPNPWPQFPGLRQIQWITAGWKAADAHLPTRPDGTKGSFAHWTRIDRVTPRYP
jgi:hypothetical protein